MYYAPRISVIMPVYNTALFLRNSIESILNQTFTDFEFIIIDDGSTDGSFEIIKSYKDPRIVLVRNIENKGLVFSLVSLNGVLPSADGRTLFFYPCTPLDFP